MERVGLATMAGRSLALDWSENGNGIRACFKIRRGPVFGQKAGWQARRGSIPASGL